MTDVRKAISGLVPTSPPESDRPVRYNGAGLLTPSTPYCQSGVTFKRADGALQEIREALITGATFFTSNWLAANRTFPDFLIGPWITGFELYATAIASYEWTLTSVANVIAYMKKRLGVDAVAPGFSWTTLYINSASGHNVTVAFPADWTLVAGVSTATRELVAVGGSTLTVKYVILNADMGSEEIGVIRTR